MKPIYAVVQLSDCDHNLKLYGNARGAAMDFTRAHLSAPIGGINLLRFDDVNGRNGKEIASSDDQEITVFDRSDPAYLHFHKEARRLQEAGDWPSEEGEGE